MKHNLLGNEVTGLMYIVLAGLLNGDPTQVPTFLAAQARHLAAELSGRSWQG